MEERHDYIAILILETSNTMPSWSAASEVRILLKEGSGAFSDAEINHLLNNAEGFLTACYKITSFTFSSAKPAHLILREAATKRAALDCLASALTLSLRTLNEVTTAMDLYRDLYNDCIGVLNAKADVSGFVTEEV